MVKLPKWPDLPEKQELEYKEKEFILTLREQIQASSKYWFIALGLLIILFFPLKLVLESALTSSFVSSVKPLQINENPFDPEDLRVARTGIVPVRAGEYGAFAQVINPNFELSAWSLEYTFVFENRAGETLGRRTGTGHILANESRFLVLPSISLAEEPASVSVKFGTIKWTTREPEFDLDLAVVQPADGVSEEGNHFVQAVIRSQQGFQIRRVRVNVLVFDQSNTEIIAVNSTEFSDLKPFEGRFFRVLWPEALPSTGRIEIIPAVNPLEPGIILETGDPVPVR